MKRCILIMGLILGIVLISGCAEKDCITACNDIPYSDNSPAITQNNLDEGGYYGSLGQKKPGTPDSWLHGGEGSKSAGWFAPRENNTERCDCGEYSPRMDKISAGYDDLKRWLRSLFTKKKETAQMQ